MGKRVAVITKEKGRQFEAIRLGLGLLLEHHSVDLFVLNHEIEPSEHCLDNLGFIDEMGGGRYSDNDSNVAAHGFSPVSLRDAGQKLADYDLVVPF
jgi:hypothetical protein